MKTAQEHFDEFDKVDIMVSRSGKFYLIDGELVNQDGETRPFTPSAKYLTTVDKVKIYEVEPATYEVVQHDKRKITLEEGDVYKYDYLVLDSDGNFAILDSVEHLVFKESYERVRTNTIEESSEDAIQEEDS